MIFGSDLDECVIDIWPIVYDIFYRHGYKLDYNEIRSYEIERVLNIPNDRIVSIIEEVVSNRAAKCYDEAVQALEIINKISSPIHFITSRNKKFREDTLHILNSPCKNLYYELHHSSREIPKSLFVNILRITHFVEDRVRYAREIAENSLAVVFLVDKPWNRKMNLEGYPRVIRVSGWFEILNYISEEMKLVHG